MRIAHLPSSYFPDALGGTEVYVRRLCSSLADLGHENAVVWHSSATEPTDVDVPEESFRLPPRDPRSRSEMYRKSADQSPPGFDDFLATWRPDIVHFHSFTLGAGLDHARSLQSAEIPYIVTYHTTAQSCQRGTMVRFGTEICDGVLEPAKCAECTLQGFGWPRMLARAGAVSPLRWRTLDGPLMTRLALPSMLAESNRQWRDFFCGARHVVACAEFVRDVLTSNGVERSRITVLRQGLPGATRRRALRLPLRTNDVLRIGFFGRFVPFKGPDVLVDAVLAMRIQGVNVRLELVGPVPACDQAWADALIKRAGATAAYLGEKRGADLTNWLDDVDMVVLPSRWLETGPFTLLEAWDRGIPALGTNIGGFRDFLVANNLSECGFKMDDAADLIRAVKRLTAWNKPAPVVEVPGVVELARHMEQVYAHCLTPMEDATLASN